METSDLILTIFIILIFIGLYLFNILGIGMNNIQKNWSIYRCNPAIMPFAGLFNHDVTKNFSFCIQNMQHSYMGEMLKPIHYNHSVLGNIGSDITDAIQAGRKFISKSGNFLAEILSTIMNVFLNILIEFQRMLMNIKDMFGKLVGVAVSMAYVITGTGFFVNSVWEGWPGQALRDVGAVGGAALCFHPNTLVKKYDNKIVMMKDLIIGDKLKNGQIIKATMNIYNLDENNDFVENLYEINNGEKNESILVSGSHLIFDKNINNFVHVKNFRNAAISNTNSDKLACLITSDHTIPLGNYIFHDWEDNDGGRSKDL